MGPPVDHPLNLAMQSVFTFGSWGLTVLVLLWAAWWGWRERTWFYVLVVLATMVGAFAEPLYDTGFMLWFYAPGMWSHFTAFGIPQPNWTHSGYAILYGCMAMCIARRIHAGRMTGGGLFAWAGAALPVSMAFEVAGIQSGVYTYWGPHVLRVFGYPIVIGVLEACQVACFGVAAAMLRRNSRRPAALLALFAVFPAVFYMANFGAGGPTIIALHLAHTSASLVLAGTLTSFLMAGILVWLAGRCLPDFSALPARAGLQAWTGSRPRLAAE